MFCWFRKPPGTRFGKGRIVLGLVLFSLALALGLSWIGEPVRHSKAQDFRPAPTAARETLPHRRRQRILSEIDRDQKADTPASAATSEAWNFREENPAIRLSIEQVANEWAETNLSSAIKWLSTLPESESRQAAILSVGYTASRDNPLAALQLALALPPGVVSERLQIHAISQWAESDSVAAMDWATKVSDAGLRQQLLAAAVVAGSETNPTAAARFVATALDPGENQNRAVIGIVQRWTQQSPQDAAAWIAQFPDIPVRVAAVENLLALWARQDAESARNWSSDLPAGTLRNSALRFFAPARPALMQ